MIWEKDKICTDKKLKTDKLYQMLDQFNEMKIVHRDFYLVLPESIHPFCERNWRTCKILLASNISF